MKDAETPFLSSLQAASFLGLSTRSLDRYPASGDGSAYHQLGYRILFHWADLKAWVAKRPMIAALDDGDPGRKAPCWPPAMAEASRILLEHHLKRLKLPTFLRKYEKLARQCAGDGLDHVRFLARLVELEMIDRARRLVEHRIRQAGFPVVKQLESFDFKAIPGLNKMLVLDSVRGDYIDRREKMILPGPSGVGKTLSPCAPPPELHFS